MLDAHRNIALSARELEVIESALQTQEKILNMQSRAGGIQSKDRLAALRGVQRRIRAIAPKEPRPSVWSRIFRAIACPRGCAEA